METNKVYLYREKPRGRQIPVLVVSGQLHGSGGLSNFWNFHPVSPDGVVSHERHGDYDNRKGKFIPHPTAQLEQVVVFRKKAKSIGHRKDGEYWDQ